VHPAAQLLGHPLEVPLKRSRGQLEHRWLVPVVSPEPGAPGHPHDEVRPVLIAYRDARTQGLGLVALGVSDMILARIERPRHEIVPAPGCSRPSLLIHCARR
jgi:hypothetical protein